MPSDPENLPYRGLRLPLSVSNRLEVLRTRLIPISTKMCPTSAPVQWRMDYQYIEDIASSEVPILVGKESSG